ncbi:MAG: NAD-dependent epimerase/dehydratase family protein [Fimbriimonadaceae bacterium]|nr:NAD-dependent epimerase/dehydratase family protein [Fimbriimonadaceae bacterium]
MRIFLTGGTGLLGVHLVRRLISDGHALTVVARNAEKASRVLPADPRVTVVAGDLEQPESLVPMLSGHDVVILAGALFNDYYTVGSDWPRFQRTNVDGTMRLLRAARDAGVDRAIFVSSSGALADPHDALLNPETLTDLYRRSKVLGELAIRNAADLRGYPIVTIRPGWIFGPDDVTPTVTGRMAKDLATKGKAEIVAGRPGPVVDARDVAEGIARVIDQVHRTDSFNLVGHNLPASDALRAICRHIPGSSVWAAPLPLAVGLSRVFEVRTRLTGVVNPMPLEGLRFLSRGHTVDGTKATRELGLAYRAFDETARDVAAWAVVSTQTNAAVRGTA